VRDALALAAAFAAVALLLGGMLFVRPRSRVVRQFTFPLLVTVAAAGMAVFAAVHPGVGLLERILSWALVFLGLIVALRLLGLVLFDVHLRGRTVRRLPPLLPAVIMAVAYVVTAFITLRLSFPSLDFAPMLATSAVTSLVLGLALQPILANFFAGLVISVERPFRINDWIRVGDHEGRVVAMTWRTTHLRTRDNDNLVVPNARLADERVLNYAYPHATHLERVRVGVDSKAPPYRVRRVLTDCAAGIPGVLDKPTPDVYLLSFDDSSNLYELRIWIEDLSQAPRIGSDLRCRIWEELGKAGISIPHPLRTVELAPRRRPPARSREAEAPAYPARLYVLEGPERGQALSLDGSAVTLGRSRACALVLSDPNASKEHLQIEWTAGEYMLNDLGSRFGTQVNGHAASGIALRRFDRITVGDHYPSASAVTACSRRSAKAASRASTALPRRRPAARWPSSSSHPTSSGTPPQSPASNAASPPRPRPRTTPTCSRSLAAAATATGSMSSPSSSRACRSSACSPAAGLPPSRRSRLPSVFAAASPMPMPVASSTATCRPG
jgi:small-conductance mechanosensitive channel